MGKWGSGCLLILEDNNLPQKGNPCVDSFPFGNSKCSLDLLIGNLHLYYKGCCMYMFVWWTQALVIE